MWCEYWKYLYVCSVEGIGVCMSLSCENEWSYGVMVSTLDSESSDPGSNPGRTSLCTILLVFFVTNIVYPRHKQQERGKRNNLLELKYLCADFVG